MSKHLTDSERQLFSVHVKPKIAGFTAMKMWRAFFFVLVREVKNLRAKAKKITRRFLRIHRPQSEHFRFVIHRRDRFYRIEIRERISVAQRFILISEVKRYGTLIEELIGLVGETF